MIVKIPFLPWTSKAALEVDVPDNTEVQFRLRVAVEISVSKKAGLTGADLRGADLTGADLRGAGLGDKGKMVAPYILQIGPIGSRRDYLVAYFTDKGVWIKAGCFNDTLAAFEEAVEKTHGTTDHGKHYHAAIELIKAMAPKGQE